MVWYSYQMSIQLSHQICFLKHLMEDLKLILKYVWILLSFILRTGTHHEQVAFLGLVKFLVKTMLEAIQAHFPI